MRPHSSRAKVSPRGVLLRGTRESTCKSSLIDRISRRTTHMLYYYHFLARENAKAAATMAAAKQKNRPRSAYMYYTFNFKTQVAKESFLTFIINAFHYYRRTSEIFALVRSFCLACRRSFSPRPPGRADGTTSRFLFRRSGQPKSGLEFLVCNWISPSATVHRRSHRSLNDRDLLRDTDVFTIR